jgi:hypothetical protein
MGRKRGAPARNINALKHGFYARQFKAEELGDLDLLLEAGSQTNLIDEIAMLRITIRRTLELANGVEDVEVAIKWLGVLGASATRIAGLLRTQQILGAKQNGDLDAIALAIQQLTEEWQLNKDPNQGE